MTPGLFTNPYCEPARIRLDCVAEPISILTGASATPPVEIDPSPCQTYPGILS